MGSRDLGDEGRECGREELRKKKKKRIIKKCGKCRELGEKKRVRRKEKEEIG